VTPYFQPTKFLLVGNANAPLSEVLARVGPVEIIESTADAIARLYKDADQRLLSKNIVEPLDSGHNSLGMNHGQRAVLIRPPQIKFLRTQSQRISVVTVQDQELNQDSIKFFTSIRKCPARKLLITSKRAVMSAIAAANNRLVDAIIFADEPNLEANLRELIGRLQCEFFERSTTNLHALLANGATAFIDDSEIAKLVSGLVQSLGATEYYVSSEPPGVLLIDQSGASSFVLIHHDEHRRAQLEIAALLNAPDALIQRLTVSNAIANFPTPSGFFDSAFSNDWQRYVWEGKTISGSTPWTFALIRNSKPADHFFERFDLATNTG
jgi:hypothetical protein